MLFIADCITFPFYEEHKDEIVLWKRARCNSVLKYLTEGESFRTNFNIKADYIYSKYNLDIPRIPYIDKNNIKCFLFSALMDDVQTTYNVDGFSLSPEAVSGKIPKWKDFLNDYKKEDPLPVEQVIDNYIKIGSLLNVNKGIILHHHYKMPEGNEKWQQRIKDINAGCLHNLFYENWKLFPIPANVPMAEDKYWVHYDSAWNKNFIETCINNLV